MSFVVKISHKGDVRRGRFSSIADVTFEGISRMVTESFGLSTYIAKYKDEEGDWCTATPTTFSDALELSAATNVLRLDIMAEPDPDTCSCTSEVSSTCSWEEVNFHGELDDSDTEADSRAMPASSKEQAETSQEQAETVSDGSASGHSCLNLAEKGQTAEPGDDTQEMPAPPQEQAVTVSEDSSTDHSCLNLAGKDQVVESHNNLQEMTTLPQEQAVALSAESAACHARPDLEETGQIAESCNTSEIRSTCPREQTLAVNGDSAAGSLQETGGQFAESHANSRCCDGCDEVADATASVAAQQEAAYPSEDRASPPRAITHSCHTSDEKIQIVLAAFDANGDGHLNFEESNELQKFAAGDHMPMEVYKMICAELRVAESRGPGKQELEILYEKYDTLQRDFEAALRKIESGTEMQEGMASQSSSGVWRSGLEPFWALPLAAAAGLCPVTVGAAAVLSHVVRSKR
eukprot:TRINITY_DN21154_c0_g1_i2.p1 TRINITY_DN21154_c0_g1~~TRINITY_DN21154_c0_g1_i2.p1  ORF type:complete len:463 (-),score=104.17 TRINITY_DN21154_c0_g1_i2:244-1632(-)